MQQIFSSYYHRKMWLTIFPLICQTENNELATNATFCIWRKLKIDLAENKKCRLAKFRLNGNPKKSPPASKGCLNIRSDFSFHQSLMLRSQVTWGTKRSIKTAAPSQLHTTPYHWAQFKRELNSRMVVFLSGSDHLLGTVLEKMTGLDFGV